jgi:hypothetical protein
MATRKLYKENQILAGTTSIAIDLTDYADFHRFYTSAAVTLTGNLSVTASGTPAKGDSIIIHYEADLDFNGNSVTVLGVTIREALESVLGTIEAYYNGSAWIVKFLAKIDETGYIGTTQIADDAITAAKIGTGAVVADGLGAKTITAAKIVDATISVSLLAASAKTETIVIPVSFETGEQGHNDVIIPFQGTITSMKYIVTKALAGTDAGTITPKVNGGSTTPTNVSISASTALNTTSALTITSGNTYNAGEVLQFVTAKTTAGGKALLSITLNRTA